MREYTKESILQIRRKNHMTQQELADYLDVSKKTVESWEYGLRKPLGPACRLLEIIEHHYLHDRIFISETYHIPVRWLERDDSLLLEFNLNKKHYLIDLDCQFPNDSRLFCYHCIFADLAIKQHIEHENFALHFPEGNH